MQDNLEHFADRLIAGMSDAIVYADVEGVIRRWNGGATRIFGFTDTEALGQSLDIIIPESLRARHWHGYRTTIQTGQSRYGEGSSCQSRLYGRTARGSRLNSQLCHSPTPAVR